MLEPKHCMTLDVITFMLYHQVVRVIKLLLQGGSDLFFSYHKEFGILALHYNCLQGAVKYALKFMLGCLCSHPY
jgi:hypothetical protein